METQKHISLLGLKVKDKVTKFEGIVTCVSFDLYGCIQAVVTPEIKEEKKLESSWYDVSRLEVLGETRVMDLPNFEYGEISEGNKGPAEKPKRI